MGVRPDDEDFESVLSDDEGKLRELLLQLADNVPDEPRSPAWGQVEELLQQFGWAGKGGEGATDDGQQII